MHGKWWKILEEFWYDLEHKILAILILFFKFSKSMIMIYLSNILSINIICEILIMVFKRLSVLYNAAIFILCLVKTYTVKTSLSVVELFSFLESLHHLFAWSKMSVLGGETHVYWTYKTLTTWLKLKTRKWLKVHMITNS